MIDARMNRKRIRGALMSVFIVVFASLLIQIHPSSAQLMEGVSEIPTPEEEMLEAPLQTEIPFYAAELYDFLASRALTYDRRALIRVTNHVGDDDLGGFAIYESEPSEEQRDLLRFKDAHMSVLNAESLPDDVDASFRMSQRMDRNMRRIVNSPITDQEVDLEYVSPGSFDVLRLNRLSYDPTRQIGLERFTPRDFIFSRYEKEIVKSYAINLEGLNFTSGTLTTTALGRVLYKCAAWNFTQQSCSGSWQKIADIIPGQPYDLILTPGDPGYVEVFDLNTSIDVDIDALDNVTIIIGFVDGDAANPSRFEIWDTNGTLKVNEVIVAAAGNTVSRLAISTINATHFATGMIDGPNQDSDFAIYDSAGTLVTGPTGVDATIGTFPDVDVCQMGDRFGYAYVDQAEGDADLRTYSNAGALVGGETNVDGLMTPEAAGQNLVSCSAINSTHMAFAFFDDADNDATVGVRNAATAQIVANLDTDAGVGETGQVSVAGLRGGRFVLAFYDSADDDITINVSTVVGTGLTPVLGNTDIDSNAGTDSRVDVTEMEFSGESYFVVAWFDQLDTTIKAGVYNDAGTQITAPFNVTTTPTASFPMVAVAGFSSTINRGLCNATFAVAYTNSSGNSVFETYWYNGTRWDGRCPEYVAPVVDQVYPPENTINASHRRIEFIYNVTDYSDIINCTLYINNTPNITNTTIAKNVNQSFFINLSNGNYNWSVRCVDEFLNVGQSATRNLNLTVFEPVVTDVRMIPQVILNAGSTRTFLCNATVNDSNGVSTLTNVNATLALYNSSAVTIDDNNTRYSNPSCSNTSAITGNSTNYTCSFALQYYAVNGTWNCSVSASDVGQNVGRNSSNTTIDPLYALNVTSPSIDFGGVSANSTSANMTLNITNFGNMPINVTTLGYGGDSPVTGDGLAMVCQNAPNITISNKRFSLDPAAQFANKAPLASSSQAMNLTVQKQILPESQIINVTYWQLFVPPMQLTSCNGTIRLTAVQP